MKTYHWVYTGKDNYIFAAILGLSDIEIEIGTQKIEQFFQQLKSKFWSKNSVQALAQILVPKNMGFHLHQMKCLNMNQI